MSDKSVISDLRTENAALTGALSRLAGTCGIDTNPARLMTNVAVYCNEYRERVANTKTQKILVEGKTS